jgi:hypothetical protein
MPRTIDVARLKRAAIGELTDLRKRIQDGIDTKLHYLLLRWMCRMTAVDAHETWERYVENRLVAALNHDPKHFLAEQNIKGVRHVSYGLARYIVRGDVIGCKIFETCLCAIENRSKLATRESLDQEVDQQSLPLIGTQK